jgi:hypothetical protein
MTRPAARRPGPTATPAGQVRPQQRVTVSGTILESGPMSITGSIACRCTLADGTGEIDLLFVGRAAIPGLAAGRGCRAEGMAALRDGRTVIWNPRYWLAPAGPDQVPASGRAGPATAGLALAGRR